MSQTSIMNIGLLVVFIGVFYLLLIRPQKKREKEEKEMRDSLKIGDEIITIGGIVGTVSKIKEKTVVISVGADKTKIEFVKTAVGSVVNKADSPAKSATVKETKEDIVEEKPVNRDKKVSPKKLGKKTESEASNATEAAADAAVESATEVVAE